MGLLDFITGSNPQGQAQNQSGQNGQQPTLQPVQQQPAQQQPAQPVSQPHTVIPKREIKPDHINPTIQNNTVNDYGTDTLAQGSQMQPVPQNDANANTPVSTQNTQITPPANTQAPGVQTQQPIEPYTPPPVQEIDIETIESKDPNSLMSEIENADPVDQSDLSTALPTPAVEETTVNDGSGPQSFQTTQDTPRQWSTESSKQESGQSQVQIGTEQNFPNQSVQVNDTQQNVESTEIAPEQSQPAPTSEIQEDSPSMGLATETPTESVAQPQTMNSETQVETPEQNQQNDIQPQETVETTPNPEPVQQEEVEVQNNAEDQSPVQETDTSITEEVTSPEVSDQQPAESSPNPDSQPEPAAAEESPSQESTMNEPQGSEVNTISQILENQQQPVDGPGVLNIDTNTNEKQDNVVEQNPADTNEEVSANDNSDGDVQTSSSDVEETPFVQGEQTSTQREPGHVLNLTKISLIGLDNLPSDQNDSLQNATVELIQAGYKLMMDTNEGGGGIVRAKAIELGSNVVSVLNQSQVTKSPEQSEQSGSKVLFSNYLEFVEYIIHESDAFVFIHPADTQDIQLFSTALHLAALYNERAKPMICVGFQWTDMVKTIVQTDNKPPVQTIRSLNDLPGALTALQEIYKKSAAEVTDETIDLREQGDEQGLTAV
jgi:hypothetical protein